MTMEWKQNILIVAITGACLRLVRCDRFENAVSKYCYAVFRECERRWSKMVKQWKFKQKTMEHYWLKILRLNFQMCKD